MLAQTTLDSGVLRVSAGDLAADVGVHRALLETLLRHAHILMGSTEDTAELVRAAKEASGEVRKLWLEVLSSGRLSLKQTNPDREGLTHITSVELLATNWKNVVDVGVLPPPHAQAFGVPEGAASWVEPVSEIELVRHDLCAEGMTFSKLRRLAEDDLRTGTTRIGLWETVLQPLISPAASVVIVDRYAGSELVHEQALRQQQGARRPTPPSGLTWLLQQIASSAGGAVAVELIVGETKECRAFAIRQAVELLWGEIAGGRIESLSVTVTTAGRGGDHGHPRHIRVGHRVVVLDKGLSIFESEAVSAPAPWKYQVGASSAAVERETVLKTFPEEVWQST